MKIKRICSKVLLILFMLGIFLNCNVIQGKCAEEEVEGNLKSKIVPLKTVKAGNGFEDLEHILIQIIMKNQK